MYARALAVLIVAASAFVLSKVYAGEWSGVGAAVAVVVGVAGLLWGARVWRERAR